MARRHRIKRLFRLRSILLSFAVIVLLIPLGSLYMFRLFEEELILRTELELISQSAALAAIYKQQFSTLNTPTDYGLSLDPKYHPRLRSKEYYQPVKPILSLSGKGPLPSRPEGREAEIKADTTATQIGEAMQPILRDTQRIMLAGMRVLDWRGIVIAGRGEVGLSLAHIEEVKRALQGYYAATIRQRISNEPPPALSSISRGTRIRLFTAYPIIQGNQLLGVIYLSRTPENILKFLYHEKHRIIWPTLAIVLVTLLLAIFLSSRIVRPIKQLITQTEQVAGGDGEEVKPIPTPGTYELAQLSESFARMANTLNERSRYIEQFASHVSHEFKTPLTAMQGALELLLEHDDMPEEQRQRFMNNLLSDTERLKALVTRLLELARADNLQVRLETADVEAVLDELQRTFEGKKLAIHFPSELSTITLGIAPDTLKTILGNLFQNSLEHGANRVEVSIREHSNKQRITLAVQDNGNGISPANRERIFTPFFTTRREQGGTGLGLGIVRSLLEAYQGSIELSDSDLGALFLLSFKVA